MSSTIIVVVPTFNSENVLGDCLESIKNQSHSPLSVVVSDGGSTDSTVSIAERWGAIVIKGDANRSAQRNSGAAQAKGDFLLFVDSDMRLTTHVLEECIATFQEGDAALVIPEIDVGTSYWARVRGFERSFYETAWWMHAARCFRTSQFLEIGGFDVSLIAAEDWELDERIRMFGGVRKITAVIEHDEGHADFERLIGKKSQYASSLELFKIRCPERAALCLSAFTRVSLVVRHPMRLLAHPILAIGMIKIGFAEIIVARGWSKRWNYSTQERAYDPKMNPLRRKDFE